jgi:signal transduction histidine kinase
MTENSAQSPAEELGRKLQAIQVFADLPQDDLLWFVAQCTEHRAAVGDIIIREGTPADSMLVVLEGEMRARSEHGNPDGPVFTARGGEVTGMLPFSRLKIVSVTGRAVLPTHYLLFPASNFPELFHRMPELTRRLVGLLADRIREVTRAEQQREKLASLGKLSAGLAHELNNPSAAARRSAAALRDCLARLRAAARSTTIGPEDCARLAQSEEEIRSSLKPAQFKDEFARIEREEAIQSWLESRNVPEAWKLAPQLADANLTDAQLARFAEAAGASVGSELSRFVTLLEMDCIAEELENSSARISELIRAIKEYSYMDQGAVQEVDIQHSIENTLTIMHHKLKRGITVTRDYAPGLPKVMASGSELNQVWTNLIDNAADAMNGNGKLGIRVARENEFILVEIADNGPGIPPEVKSRIFDPFFTTKGVGEGTGLGLDVVNRIIKNVGGQISVTSVPGDTRFQVRIPIQAPVQAPSTAQENSDAR